MAGLDQDQTPCRQVQVCARAQFDDAQPLALLYGVPRTQAANRTPGSHTRDLTHNKAMVLGAEIDPVAFIPGCGVLPCQGVASWHIGHFFDDSVVRHPVDMNIPDREKNRDDGPAHRSGLRLIVEVDPSYDAIRGTHERSWISWGQPSRITKEEDDKAHQHDEAYWQDPPWNKQAEPQ
jgi:hypothetical protein